MVKSSNFGFCLLLSKVSSWSSAMVGRWQDEDLPRTLLWTPSFSFWARSEVLSSGRKIISLLDGEKIQLWLLPPSLKGELLVLCNGGKVKRRVSSSQFLWASVDALVPFLGSLSSSRRVEILRKKKIHSSMVKRSNLGFCLFLSKVSSWSSAMVGRWQDDDLPLNLFELPWMPSSPFWALSARSEESRSTTPPPDLVQISLLAEDVRSDLTHSLFSSSLVCCPLTSIIVQTCILIWIPQETMHNWLQALASYSVANLSLISWVRLIPEAPLHSVAPK